MFKTFKKIIKLRNATSRKNYWNRTYLPNPQLSFFIKISDLLPTISAKQALIRCITNYIQNNDYSKLLCECSKELSINESTLLTETLNVIKQPNESTTSSYDNLLLIAKNPFDKVIKHQLILQLIEIVQKQIKALKKENNKYNDNFIYNFMIIQRGITPQEPKCKLYTVFPNINFHLKAIKNLSLSSKVDLNSLLISRHNKSILNTKGEQLINGFVTMSNEKRIITLIDDTTVDLKASKSLKQIIFGIWISLKNEDIGLYNNDIDELIRHKKYLIYKKCLHFLLISSKIETIYSPSPDECMFLLILFFQGTQRFYEVKVLPNEEGKTLTAENAEINGLFANNYIDVQLESFSNQWLIMKRHFTIQDSQLNCIKIDNKNINIFNTLEYITKLQGNKFTVSKSSSAKKSGSSSNMVTSSIMGKTNLNYQSSNNNNNNNTNLITDNNNNSHSNSNNNNHFSSNSKKTPLFDSLKEIFEEPSNEFFNNLKTEQKHSFESRNNEPNSIEVQIPTSNLKGSYCHTTFNKKTKNQSCQTILTYEDLALLSNSNISIQNSQRQTLNNTIKEQSLSIQNLQQRVNHLTLMLQQVTTLLNEKEKSCICKKHKVNNTSSSSPLKNSTLVSKTPQMNEIRRDNIYFNNVNTNLIESQSSTNLNKINYQDKIVLGKTNIFSTHSKLENNIIESKDFDNEYLINNNHPQVLSVDIESPKNDGSNNSSLLNLSQSNSGEKSINVPTIKYNPETSSSFI